MGGFIVELFGKNTLSDKISGGQYFRPRGALGVAMAALVTSWVMFPVSGETLKDALAVAYKTNPTLQSQRARLRASGELKYQAIAALLPQVNAQGSYLFAETDQESAAGGAFNQVADLEQLSLGANADLLLFDGFRSIQSLKQAAAQIGGAEAQLVGVEQQLMLDVATTYFDVVRDLKVYSLNKTNVEVLLRQLDQAEVRFRVGENTRTDVAQASARVAGARAALTSASSQLSISRARYVELVGQSPGTLEVDGPEPVLPKSLEEAKTLAMEIAPAILIAKAGEEVSRRSVKIAKGSFAPTITATANYQFADEPSTFIQRSENFAYGARVNLPIFQGGARLSQVRQAKANNDADRQQIYATERQVTAQVVSAWEQLLAARANIESSQAQVEANRLALEGVKKEELVGARDTLDVLNAELEALNAEVSLETARRNASVASYGLMAAVGMLTPNSVGVVVYEEPQRGFKRFLPWKR